MEPLRSIGARVDLARPVVERPRTAERDPVRERFSMLIMQMAAGLAGECDAVKIMAYWRAFRDVPIPLMEAAVTEVSQHPGITFVPTVPEFREFIQLAERKIKAAHPHQPCASCLDSPGWVEVTCPDGVRMDRCTCWTAHRAKLARLGVGTKLQTARGTARI